MSDDSTRSAWVYLNTVIEGPSRQLHQLFARGYSPEEVAEGIKRREKWIGTLLRTTERRYNVANSEELLEKAYATSLRFITPDDPEWPSEQFDQAFGFAASGTSEHLRSYASDAVAPHGLWVRGGDLSEAVAQSVAIVGTRAMSSYGERATECISRGLAEKRWTVVSGGAFGVDSVAHRTALAQGGVSVAVAAHGLHRCYPHKHRELFKQIVDTGGCWVSEYPPDTPPARHRFLTRNRLVAALTAGTVVVEAAWRSGALNTLAWANGLGKVAMAVPGPIIGAGSLGCHDKIKQGSAQLVVSAEDVISLAGSYGASDPDGQYELAFPGTAVQRLSRNELRVFDAIPTAGEPDCEAEEIARRAGLSAALTVRIIVELERAGLIRRQRLNWVKVEK